MQLLLPSSAQLQVKHSLKAELALISVNPATHPHPRHPGKFIFQHFLMDVGQVRSYQLEDDLNFLEYGRRPQFLRKWKTTSFLGKMEDDLKILGK